MKIRKIAALVLAGAMAFSLAACGGSGSSNNAPAADGNGEATTAAASGNASDTLTWIIPGDISGLDPTVAYDDYTNTVVNQVTEGLLKFDSDVNCSTICNLASDWEIVDELTYVYHVRDDIKFSDGNPMTMEDVMWSIKRNQDPEVASYLGWMYDAVESIEQTGDWEITVKLAVPDATWQYTFATTGGHIIEKAAYEADGSIIATGPYKYESWVTGSQVVITRNENYSTTDTKPYWSKIVYNIISEDTTRVEALTTGQADYALNCPVDMIPQLEESPTVTVHHVDTFGIDFLAFNTQKAPFDDKYVRQAICYAIDLDMIYDSLLSTSKSKSTGLPFNESLYASVGDPAEWAKYAETYPKYEYNMEKAKECLAKSAYPDGFTCKLQIDTASVKNSMALYMQQALAELGITVEINKVSGAEEVGVQVGSIWDQTTDSRDYDMGMFTWYADYPDAAGNVVPNFVSDNKIPGGCNVSGYENAEVDRLFKEQLTKTNPAERGKLIMEALDIMGEEVPVYIMDYPQQLVVKSATFNDFYLNSCYQWNNYAINIYRK